MITVHGNVELHAKKKKESWFPLKVGRQRKSDSLITMIIRNVIHYGCVVFMVIVMDDALLVIYDYLVE
jgi:hypothetical protein